MLDYCIIHAYCELTEKNIFCFCCELFCYNMIFLNIIKLLESHIVRVNVVASVQSQLLNA